MLKQTLDAMQKVFDWFYWKRQKFSDWRFRRSLRKKGDE